MLFQISQRTSSSEEPDVLIALDWLCEGGNVLIYSDHVAAGGVPWNHLLAVTF